MGVFDELRLRSLRRKLRRSIETDRLVPKGCDAWLDGVQTVADLRAKCPEASWLVHCAYWDGVKGRPLFVAAMQAVKICIDWRSHPFRAGPMSESVKALFDCVFDEATQSVSDAVVKLIVQAAAEAPVVHAALADVQLGTVDAFGFEAARLIEVGNPLHVPERRPQEARDERAVAAAYLGVAWLQNERGDRANLAVALGRALASVARAWPDSHPALVRQLRQRLPPA